MESFSSSSSDSGDGANSAFATVKVREAEGGSITTPPEIEILDSLDSEEEDDCGCSPLTSTIVLCSVKFVREELENAINAVPNEVVEHLVISGKEDSFNESFGWPWLVHLSVEEQKLANVFFCSIQMYFEMRLDEGSCWYP